jgi:hypothetical protein
MPVISFCYDRSVQTRQVHSKHSVDFWLPYKAVIISTVMMVSLLLCVTKCINSEMYVRDERTIRGEFRFCRA